MDAGYDIPSIARDLDWIAVMTYDYHGHWDKKCMLIQKIMIISIM